jgi:hypothetical protein
MRSATGKASPKPLPTAIAAAVAPVDPLAEFTSLLFAVSSQVDEAGAAFASGALRARLEAGEDMLEALGQTLAELFGPTAAEAKAKATDRAIPPPGASAANRADMLIAIDDDDDPGKKGLPIFVTATDATDQVLTREELLCGWVGGWVHLGPINRCRSSFMGMVLLSILLMHRSEQGQEAFDKSTG